MSRTQLRTCKKCGVEWLRVGKKNDCPTCRAAYMRKWRSKNPDKTRRYTVASRQKEAFIKARQKRDHYMYNVFPEVRLKQMHRSNFNHAVKRGEIAKLPCAECGCTVNLFANHRTYTLPYDVFWLCREHHYERQRMLRSRRDEE